MTRIPATEESLQRTVAHYLARCTETLVTVLLSLLGLGAMRTVGKFRGKAR